MAYSVARASGYSVARESKEKPVPDEAVPGAEDQAQTEQSTAPQDQAEGTQGGQDLFDLNDVPENLRSQVEPILKKWDSTVNEKFREYAEQRKQWEPYQNLGVTEQDPERLQALLELGNVLDDEDLFPQWLEELATQFGYSKEDSEDEKGDELLTPEQVKEMVAEQISPINEKLTQQEQEQLVAQAHEDITNTLDRIGEKDPSLAKEIGKSEEGKAITGRDVVLQMALAYEDEENPIEKGYADYQRLVSSSENGIFEKKANQPAGAEGPGSPAGPERVTSFEEANKRAAQRLEASRVT